MKEIVVAKDMMFALSGRGYQLLLGMVDVGSTVIDLNLEWGYTLVAIDDAERDSEKIELLCECADLEVVYDEEEEVYTLCESTGGCNRESPYLVQLVKKYEGVEPISSYDLKIIEIPKDVEYVVMPIDIGGEYVAEKHRTWF